MSKLKELGFNIEFAIRWINQEKTAAQATYTNCPYGIDQTATPQQWEALIEDIANGTVVVQDMAQPIGLSVDGIAAAARCERNRLLTESDWTQISEAPIIASKRAEWATYRKALRDLTNQSGFPQTVVWPQTP